MQVTNCPKYTCNDAYLEPKDDNDPESSNSIVCWPEVHTGQRCQVAPHLVLSKGPDTYCAGNKLHAEEREEPADTVLEHLCVYPRHAVASIALLRRVAMNAVTHGDMRKLSHPKIEIPYARTMTITWQ